MKIREKDLRRALQRREMVLHYQPIVGLKSARIVAVEALLRWPLPSGRVLAPGEFIPVAERTRLILPLGTWVLRQACLQTRVWQTRHPRHAPVTISVNMSARQFLLGDQVGVIAQALDVSGLAPEYLRLEITESSVLEHSTKSLAQLRALEQMGVQIAIDDFGTGYSSLSRLNAFPVSQLKIDRSFVGAIGDEQSAKPLVLATIQLAHSLGLKAVAEGVETSEQWSFLRRNGCEEAQGYMLSRPVPAEIIDQLLAADAPLTRARGDHLGLRLPASLTTRAVAGVAAAALATGWVSAAAAGAPATALASQVAASLGDHTAGLVTLPPATVRPVSALTPPAAATPAQLTASAAVWQTPAGAPSQISPPAPAPGPVVPPAASASTTNSSDSHSPSNGKSHPANANRHPSGNANNASSRKSGGGAGSSGNSSK